MVDSCYEWHHRRPRGMGGSRDRATNSPANALLLCGRCHRICEQHREVARQHGYLVRQGVDPGGVAVWRWGQWVHLDDTGGVRPSNTPPMAGQPPHNAGADVRVAPPQQQQQATKEGA
jgi:hypothetical protein